MDYKKSTIFLFLPFFLIRNIVFDCRKNNAIKKAKNRSLQLGKTVYVFQIKRRFVVGTRNELRRINKVGRKYLRHTGSHLLDFDYRNSIVYIAGNMVSKSV
jgi:hypothetical protein